MRISVVIPVRNEEQSIGNLLDGLLTQTLLPDEIVITDGGSTDQTISIIQQYINRGAPVQLIRTTHALPGRGRNLAAAHASSEWLAFTDAGIRPRPDWLQLLAAAAVRVADTDVVYGSYEPIIDSFLKECAAIAYVPAKKQVEGHYMRPRSVVSMLLRRELWESVGGFPEDLRSAEDLLFMNKLDQANCRVTYASGAVVHWSLQPSLWLTLKRFLVYSRNNIRAGLWAEWQGPILRRYLLLALTAIPALFLSRWWLAIPLGLWLLMMAARAAVAIHRNKHSFPAGPTRNLLRLLVLIPILLVLDLGSLVGTIQWLLTDKLRLRSEAVTAGHDA